MNYNHNNTDFATNLKHIYICKKSRYMNAAEEFVYMARKS